MCGRAFTTYTEEDLYLCYLNRNSWTWRLDTKIPDFKPNYNLCPTQTALVLCVTEGTLSFREMRWGLVPSWAKTVKDADKYSMINAKCEEVAEKRSYKAAFQRRRCIVPVSGFFEWQKAGTVKKPFAIFCKDKTIMSLAGIWEHWVSSSDNSVVDSFSLLTMASNEFMEKIHTRMPVILDRHNESLWLDPALTDVAAISKLMKPFPAAGMDAYEVSTLVNSPRNNRSEVLAPVATN